jgi:hypothetical protein
VVGGLAHNPASLRQGLRTICFGVRFLSATLPTGTYPLFSLIAKVPTSPCPSDRAFGSRTLQEGSTNGLMSKSSVNAAPSSLFDYLSSRFGRGLPSGSG